MLVIGIIVISHQSPAPAINDELISSRGFDDRMEGTSGFKTCHLPPAQRSNSEAPRRLLLNVREKAAMRSGRPHLFKPLNNCGIVDVLAISGTVLSFKFCRSERLQ